MANCYTPSTCIMSRVHNLQKKHELSVYTQRVSIPSTAGNCMTNLFFSSFFINPEQCICETRLGSITDPWPVTYSLPTTDLFPVTNSMSVTGALYSCCFDRSLYYFEPYFTNNAI